MPVTTQTPVSPAAAPPGVVAIFLLFLRIGLLSFGGGLSGWVFREVVVKRRWIAEDDFMSGMALGQMLPGTNITNLSVYVGQRLRGPAGSLAALFGLLSGPFVAVLLLASAYGFVRQLPYADAAMDGLAAAAIGLLLVVALRGVRRAARKPAGAIAAAATFAGVGLMHLPLLAVVVVVGAASVAAVWYGGAADAR
jgi:chromate transporter